MHKNICPITTWGLGLILAGWLLVGLTGCCNRNPGLLYCCGRHTQKDYGHSVTHNIASQIVDPEAGRQVYVSRGLPPDAAVNAYEKYNKTFKPEDQKPLMQLTTGGGQ
jgi:hypothetical protein